MDTLQQWLITWLYPHSDKTRHRKHDNLSTLSLTACCLPFIFLLDSIITIGRFGSFASTPSQPLPAPFHSFPITWVFSLFYLLSVCVSRCFSGDGCLNIHAKVGLKFHIYSEKRVDALIHPPHVKDKLVSAVAMDQQYHCMLYTS